jgi:hypothetical protein
MSSDLECCLCGYSAPNDFDLQAHIEYCHSSIFTISNPSAFEPEMSPSESHLKTNIVSVISNPGEFEPEMSPSKSHLKTNIESGISNSSEFYPKVQPLMSSPSEYHLQTTFDPGFSNSGKFEPEISIGQSQVSVQNKHFQLDSSQPNQDSTLSENHLETSSDSVTSNPDKFEHQRSIQQKHRSRKNHFKKSDENVVIKNLHSSMQVIQKNVDQLSKPNKRGIKSKQQTLKQQQQHQQHPLQQQQQPHVSLQPLQQQQPLMALQQHKPITEVCVKKETAVKKRGRKRRIEIENVLLQSNLPFQQQQQDQIESKLKFETSKEMSKTSRHTLDVKKAKNTLKRNSSSSREVKRIKKPKFDEESERERERQFSQNVPETSTMNETTLKRIQENGETKITSSDDEESFVDPTNKNRLDKDELMKTIQKITGKICYNKSSISDDETLSIKTTEFDFNDNSKTHCNEKIEQSISDSNYSDLKNLNEVQQENIKMATEVKIRPKKSSNLEIQHLEEKSDDIKSERSLLEEEIERLKKEKEDKNSEMSLLDEEIERLRKEKEETESVSNAMESKLIRMSQKCLQVETEKKVLTEKLKKMEFNFNVSKRANDGNEELKKSKEIIFELSAKLKSSSATISQLKLSGRALISTEP